MHDRVMAIALAVALTLSPGFASAAPDPDAPGKLTPTPITLHVKDISAHDALEQMLKSANLTLSVYPPESSQRLEQARVTIDADAQPFWTVLASICDAAGVRPLGMKQEREIVVGYLDGAWASAFTAVAGPFVVALTRIDLDRTVNYGIKISDKDRAQRPNAYTLTFEVAVEPALAAQFNSVGPLLISKCVDQDEFPISTTSPQILNQRAIMTGTVTARSVVARKISAMEGSCTFLMAANPKHVDVPNIMAAHEVPVDAGDSRLQIKSLEKSSGQYVLKVLVLRDKLSQEKIDEVVKVVSRSKPVFLDNNGKKLNFVLVGPKTSPVANGMLITMPFNPSMQRDPKSMSWDIPASLQSITVPFRFRDIPLPAAPPSMNPAAPDQERRPIAISPATQPATDYVAEVGEIVPQLSATSAQTREDAMARLSLLLPHGFDAIEAASKRNDVPQAAHAKLLEFVDRNAPLQAARLRRAQVAEEERLWNERDAIRNYGLVGHHDPKWDALVVKAVHLFCHSVNNFTPEARQPFEAALEAGCDDPMVVSMAGWIVELSGGEPRQVLKFYDQADIGFHKMRYPDSRRIENTIRYISLLRRTSSHEAIARAAKFIDPVDAKKLNNLRTQMMNEWQMAARATCPPGMLVATAERLMSITQAAPEPLEPFYQRVAPILEEALPDKPQPLIFKGKFYTQWAWEARGDDTADKVTKPGWKFFAERLKVAEEALTRAYGMDPTDPAAATQMLAVELGQSRGNDAMEKWFNRAMDADPDNYSACAAKLYYLEPKWHGSPEEMLHFANECFRSGNYGGRIPMILAEAHNSLAAYLPRKQLYFADPAVWRDIQRVYEPYLRVRPDDTFDRSAYCLYACWSGHWAVAAEQFEILGNNVDTRWIGRDQIDELRKQAKQKSTRQDSL